MPPPTPRLGCNTVVLAAPLSGDLDLAVHQHPSLPPTRPVVPFPLLSPVSRDHWLQHVSSVVTVFFEAQPA